MRITTGIYKGRVLSVPPGDSIRPTSDRMRQALFNILQQYALPADARVVDVFCGSGALGLEALSRGAMHATFIDSDTAACEKNVRAFKAENATILKRDALKPGVAGDAADLAFVDPPYNKDLAMPALTALAQNGWLAPSAICAVETEAHHEAAIPAGFHVLDRRDYGAARLHLIRYGD